MVQHSPAGWHADPFNRCERRYWDGHQWTHHVIVGGAQTVDPPVVAAPRPEPRPHPAGWWPDPFGRYQQRYWDGVRWTDQVASHGRQAVDAPIDHRAAAPAESKKVERQVRNAGVIGIAVGGGTLFTEQVLVVNQRAKLFGSTVGYAVFNQQGRQVGTVEELRRDVTTVISDKLRLS